MLQLRTDCRRRLSPSVCVFSITTSRIVGERPIVPNAAQRPPPAKSRPSRFTEDVSAKSLAVSTIGSTAASKSRDQVPSTTMPAGIRQPLSTTTPRTRQPLPMTAPGRTTLAATSAPTPTMTSENSTERRDANTQDSADGSSSGVCGFSTNRSIRPASLTDRIPNWCASWTATSTHPTVASARCRQ